MGCNSNSCGFILKLSYSIIIFILIQLKKILLFPNSIIKIHKNVIDSINKVNKKVSECLNGIKVELYNESKLNVDIFQDFKNYIKEKKNLEVKYEQFSQIINLIYEKLFGCKSSLYLFFEGQNLNLEIDDNNISKSAEGKKTNFSQDYIDYINQVEMKLEDNEEISLRKKNENEPINLPSFGEMNSNNNNEKQSGTSENEYSEHLKV